MSRRRSSTSSGKRSWTRPGTGGRRAAMWASSGRWMARAGEADSNRRMVPGSVLSAEGVDQGPAGCVCVRALSRSQAVYIADMSNLIESVTAVARRHLPEESRVAVLGPNTDLAELGLDSVQVVGFMVDMERTFGISFPDELINLGTFRTVGAVAEAVRTLR